MTNCWNDTQVQKIHKNDSFQMFEKVVFGFYRSQRSCEGYVFTGVCLSTRGRCLPKCMLGYTPRTKSRPPGTKSRHPPDQKQTSPRDQRQTLPRQTATAVDGTHPTGMHSCSKEQLLRRRWSVKNPSTVM